MKKETKAHISLHISNSNTLGTLVVQPRNANGTFRSPVRAFEAQGSTFHIADYTSHGGIFRARLTK